DAALEARRKGAGSDYTYRTASLDHVVAVARHRTVGHLDADEPALEARGARALDGGAADEIALGGLDHPAQACLERIGGLVDVVAVERELHLEPESVAGAETNRLDPVASPFVQERVPEGHAPLRGYVELEAVLARVARAGDEAGHACHAALGEVVVEHLRDVAVGEALDEGFRLGSLHREERRRLAHVRPRRAAAAVGDPRPVLVDVGR